MDNFNQDNNDRYSYTVHRPEGGLIPGPSYGETPPPPKKKKSRAPGLIALTLVMCIVSAGIGGTAGYWAGGLSGSNETQSPAQTTENPQTQVAANPTYTPVAANDGRALTPTQIFEKCNPAVVAISTEKAMRNMFGQSTNRASAGSGFLISDDGVVITNHHVIDGADSIKVLMADGKTYDATVVGSDATADIAVLKIKASGLPYLTFGDSEAMRVGDTVCAIGNPLGELANTQTVGTISAMGREVNIDGIPAVMLQTDASVSPGNSGGPLINIYGDVIGIVSAKSVDTGVEGIGFAIPASSAQANIADLQKNGYIQGRPYLGITADPDYSAFARQYRMPAGVYIASVETGSCAERAGLKVGDVILELGGDTVSDSATLQAAKLKHKAGETISLRYYRDGKEYTANVTLDEMPQNED